MTSSRRLFAVATVLLFAASSLPAQISWGPSVGINIATLAGDDVPTNTKSTIGFAAGLTLDKSSEGKALFWRTGAHYSMQGAEAEEAGVTGKTKLTYINIPILAGWKFQAAKANSPYALVGPQLGLNAGCDLDDGTTTVSCKDAGFEAKSMDFGAVVGAGMGMAAGASMIHIAATYTLGLATASDTEPATDFKNRVLAITVSYMMPSKRAVNPKKSR